MTQQTSNARVKKDLIGNQGLTDLYKAYAEEDDLTFLTRCMQLVDSSGGSKSTKNKFKFLLSFSKTKVEMLNHTNNFILAGMGLGV